MTDRTAAKRMILDTSIQILLGRCYRLATQSQWKAYWVARREITSTLTGRGLTLAEYLLQTGQ